MAASVIVQNTNDDGAGSLRDALAQVTGQTGAHTITFAPTLAGQTITLLTPVEITNNVRIEGPASGLTIAMKDGTGAYLSIGDGDEPEISFTNLTLTAPNDGDYVINNDLGNVSGLAMDNVTVNGTVLLQGNLGQFTLTDSTVTMGGFSIGNGVTNIVVDGLTIDHSTDRVYTAFEVASLAGDVSLTNITTTGATLGEHTVGITLSTVNGTVSLTDSTFTDTAQILRIDGGDTTRSIVIDNVTGTTENNESGAITSDNVGPGGLTVTNSSFTGYDTGINLDSTEGPVVFADVTIDGNGSQSAAQGISVRTLDPATFTFDRVTVADYQNGMYLVSPNQGGNTMQVRDSILRDITQLGLNVTTLEQDINIERTLFDTMPNAIEGTCDPGGAAGDKFGTMRISASTFTEVMGDDGHDAAVRTNECLLHVSNSTFSDADASRDNARYHFINMTSPLEAAGVVATIAQSTFAGSGVLYAYLPELADQEQEVAVSAVIADSIDAPGSVTIETRDLNLNGGRARIDSSLFSAAQAELDDVDAGSTDFVWGSGNHFSVTAAQRDLGPLQDNSGPTPTRVPLANSIAREAVVGTPVVVPAATDQRGQARVVGIQEIGAVELNPGRLSLNATQTVRGGNNATITVTKHPGLDAAYQAITGTVTFAPGTATAGTDYTTNTTHTVTLAPGTNQTTITVPTKAINNRGTRTFTAALTSGVALTQAPTTGTITITHPTVTTPGGNGTGGSGTGTSTSAGAGTGSGATATQMGTLGQTGLDPALWLVLMLGVLLTVAGTTAAVRARRNDI